MELQDQKQIENNKPYIIRDDHYAMKPQEPIDYIIENLITNASVNIFYGEPGSKKTYSLLNMAVNVANGKNWLNFKTKQSSVLFIDEESGEKRFSRRLNESILGENCIPNGKIKYVSLGGFKFDKSICVKALESEILENNIQLVIIDALAEIMDGDENSKKDVQPVMSSLKKIADNTNCAIIIIHHSNKGGGYRGSSVIKASSDLMMQVSSDPNNNVINFVAEKNRDGITLEFAAKANWDDKKFWLDIYDNSEKLNPKEEYIINYLKNHGESLVEEIIKDVSICPAETLRKTIYSLKQKGKIYKTASEGKQHSAKYDLVS